MPTTTVSRAGDAYLELVRRMPLRRLRSTAEHAAAVRVLTRLSLAHQGTRDRDVLDYLDVLASLIDQHEIETRAKVDASRASPADVVRHLMAENRLSVSQLARETGVGQSNLSEMISGRRDFSRAAIAKPSRRFGLSPAVFF